MLFRLVDIGISSEQDVVLVRQRARQIAQLLAFGAQDQVRIATAISELSRNVFAYSAGGRVAFAVDRLSVPPALDIAIKSTGGGLRDTAAAAAPGFDQGDALQDALSSARRLMDTCTVDQEGGRATVIGLRKILPMTTSIAEAALVRVASQISAIPLANSFSEAQLQNKELLDTLAELRVKQDDLLALTQELEDTNRGVVALYAEVEEKAERLRQADDMKSRFLSNTSHELRTPLSSIRALARLLIDRVDGELTEEQDKQVRFIERAAMDLSELVNDLLDLAKIEAGKVELRYSRFPVSELFSALRGMLRPLSANTEVDLIFEDPAEALELVSDEGKVSQILRNFISNALKFTEQGAVRVSATRDLQSGETRLAVVDSGIGIAPENWQFVFEEFSQVESAIQSRIKGTGLGLPLCRKLAQSLGGRVELVSALGTGATFSLILPAQNLTGEMNNPVMPLGAVPSPTQSDKNYLDRN